MKYRIFFTTGSYTETDASLVEIAMKYGDTIKSITRLS